MLDVLMHVELWANLLTLTLLEIVLGVDNLVFIAIVTERLPREKRAKARRLGLFMALFMRIALLFSLVWLTHLNQPLLNIAGWHFSGRDLVFIVGGLFLLWKAIAEIGALIAGLPDATPAKPHFGQSRFTAIIIQIMIFDIIFSLDSIITAVGLSQQVWVMASAILIAVIIMMMATNFLSEFIEKNPSVKILALSFLILIGGMLIGDGLQYHLPRGYIYFSIGFSIMVECLNGLMRKKQGRMS